MPTFNQKRGTVSSTLDPTTIDDNPNYKIIRQNKEVKNDLQGIINILTAARNKTENSISATNDKTLLKEYERRIKTYNTQLKSHTNTMNRLDSFGRGEVYELLTKPTKTIEDDKLIIDVLDTKIITEQEFLNNTKDYIKPLIDSVNKNYYFQEPANGRQPFNLNTFDSLKIELNYYNIAEENHIKGSKILGNGFNSDQTLTKTITNPFSDNSADPKILTKQLSDGEINELIHTDFILNMLNKDLSKAIPTSNKEKLIQSLWIELQPEELKNLSKKKIKKVFKDIEIEKTKIKIQEKTKKLKPRRKRPGRKGIKSSGIKQKAIILKQKSVNIYFEVAEKIKAAILKYLKEEVNITKEELENSINEIINTVARNLDKYQENKHIIPKSISLKLTNVSNKQGIWHFLIRKGYENDFSDIIGGNKRIYSSRALNYDCGFFSILCAISNKFSIIFDNAQEIINNYKRLYVNTELIETPLSSIIAKHFAIYIVDLYGLGCKIDMLIYNDKISKNTNCLVKKYKNDCQMTLRICIISYKEHSFLANPTKKNYDIILKGLKVLPITNTTCINKKTLSFEEIIKHVPISNKKKSLQFNDKGIIIIYDTETIKVRSSFMEQHCDCIINTKGIDKYINMPTSLQYQIIEYVYDAETNSIEFNDLTVVITKEHLKEADVYTQFVSDYNELLENDIETYNKKVYMIAHNGGKFDTLVLAPLLNKNAICCKVQGAQSNNPLYEHTFGVEENEIKIKFFFRDSLQYIGKSSLYNLGITYGIDQSLMKYNVENKKAWFDRYTKLYKAYINNDLEKFNKYNEKVNEDIPGDNFSEQFESYGANDITSLVEIVKKHAYSFTNNCDVDIIKQNPIGALSEATLARKPLEIMTSKCDTTINQAFNKSAREAGIGGRTLMLSKGFLNRELFNAIPEDELKNLFNPSNLNYVNKLRKLKPTKTGGHLIYTDARSLYPSAMIKYKYPTKFLGPIENIKKWTNFYNTVINDTTFNKVINHDIQAILQVRLRKGSGMFNCMPIKSKEGLLYKHRGKVWSDPLMITSIDLARFILYNKGEFEILSGFKFEMEYIFKTMENLYQERLKYKKLMYTDKPNKDSWNLKQLNVKLIMNSVYGKLLQRQYTEEFTKRADLNKPWIGIKTMYGSTFNTYSTLDLSTNRAHIGAFVLSYSKVLMDRVIDHLGGKEGNIFNEWNPIYSTDTDSFSCYEDDYEAAAKVLKIPTIDAPGGFHLDTEVEGAVKNIEVIAAIWVVAKTYILLCQGEDKEGKLVYQYHRRGKGLKNTWIAPLDLIDYLKLSKMENRSMKKYCSTIPNTESLEFFRMASNKTDGYITNEDFDRAFPHADKIGKHRELPKKYVNPLLCETPSYLKAL